MLKKRSRATTKQAPMADCSSLSSPTGKYTRLTTSIFSSLASKSFTETESVLSPTSIVDTIPFPALKNPFWSDKQTLKFPKPETRTQWERLDYSRRVGLGIVDALADENSDPILPKSNSRMVLFGSQLKIQIPSSILSTVQSPKSPADFGIKTRTSQLGSFSPSLGTKSPFGSANSGPETPNSPATFTVPASEMELSEDYTRVISRGPNPRTTHIFDDCVVEISAASKMENGFYYNRSLSFPSESFLSFCHTCRKNLGQGKDIYIYRGEKAFCSSECRHKEMMLEEKMGKLES
ncbi:FCS-Like Zinc finger 8 [Diospyros lotus]|uniref:FCS-Like Zinc finger 8 n=1 Tax=Diospyros lotus TaxID=55363 RepID=UPI0022575B1E|nr:FCS-Like Zinc finger 8 [Diospyros lotus]